MAEWTQEALINAAKEFAKNANGPFSSREFRRGTNISSYHIWRLFPNGGWTELRERAEIERHPHDIDSYTDEQLLKEYHRVATEVGSLPTWARFVSLARVSRTVLNRRFGGKKGLLPRYQEWLRQKEPNSSLLAQIDLESKHKLATPIVDQAKKSVTNPKWAKKLAPNMERLSTFEACVMLQSMSKASCIYLASLVENLV